MHNFDLRDTIVAIATPLGEGGIGIVRISGKEALAIADKIFKAKDGRKPSSYKTHTVHYGWIVDTSAQADSVPTTHDPRPSTPIIDEVLLTVMRAPRTYTKEDIVEINCHGGITVLRRVLEHVLGQGARMAEPGEFTKRAFLNGRIDLTQAEAVLDIIRAKTEAALQVGITQLKGPLSQKIRELANNVLEILTPLEASIEFPDEEIGILDGTTVRLQLATIHKELTALLASARHGRVLREGVHVVICGKPNVGKSSLLNALLKYERSIVTPVAGTTRDTIEEIIDIRGIPVRIVDTAGIIEPRDLVERKAIERSKKQIALADIVLLVFDGSRRLSAQDFAVMRRFAPKKTIAIVNKIDVRQRIEKEKIRKRFGSYVELSAKKMTNLDALEDAVEQFVYGRGFQRHEAFIVSNARHIEKISKSEKLIAESLSALDNTVSAEFISQDLKDAVGHLEEVLGQRVTEDLLDRIFSEFCVGK